MFGSLGGTLRRRSTPRDTAPAFSNLVAGAIVLWNAIYLEAAMRYLNRQGRPVPPDLLQHLFPLRWQYINLTGDYLWAGPGASDGTLRPLRQTTRLPP